ncbi:MAG: SRPBCC family protein [Kiloniellales bacterium]
MLDQVETGGLRQPQDRRRQQLIDATVRVIAEHGLSNVTLMKVAGLAGLTAGMVNFHFKSKQELLKATLERIAEEFSAACEAAIAGAGRDPAAALMALTEASFDERLATPEKMAVWYGFWGESQARDDYMEICGGSDQAFYEAVHTLIAELDEKQNSDLDSRAAALGFCGLIDALWQEALVRRGAFDREASVDLCRRYLVNLFGTRAFPPRRPLLSEVSPTAGEALPAWTYSDEDFFRREMERIHLPAWQLICHVSELKRSGDYVAFEGFGERAFAVRGKDMEVRAFHNVCRHRAHAVVGGQRGSCPGLISCPYHAWTYDLEGRLRGVPSEKGFKEVDKESFGLKQLDCEIFLGFVYICFRTGARSVAERYAPYREELSHYRFEEMEPISDYWRGDTAADWKCVWDNYLEDYHFPVGHPGLSALMTTDYERGSDEATRTVRLSHALREEVKGGWGVRHYAKLLPTVEHLPEAQRRRWSYYFLYPAVSFDVYPEMMDYFHIVPIAPGRSRLRWRAYALPDSSRAMRATRWLNQRVNFQVHDEDATLVESVQRGLNGSGYETGLLNDKESAVRAFQSWIRADLPESNERRSRRR